MVLFGPVTFCSRNYTVLFPWYCTSASTVQVCVATSHFRRGISETNLGARGLATSPSLEASVRRVTCLNISN